MTTGEKYTPPFYMLGKAETARTIGVSVATLNRLASPKTPGYDATFPEPLKIGVRHLAWRSDEIEQWLIARPRGRLASPEGALAAKRKQHKGDIS